jgi:hypothetical protein
MLVEFSHARTDEDAIKMLLLQVVHNDGGCRLA